MHIRNKPPPQSRSCLLLKKGEGAYFREDMVYYWRPHDQDYFGCVCVGGGGGDTGPPGTLVDTLLIASIIALY